MQIKCATTGYFMLEAGGAILFSSLSILLIFKLLTQNLYWESEGVNRLEALYLSTQNKKFVVQNKKIDLVPRKVLNYRYPKSAFLEKKILWRDLNNQEKYLKLFYYEN